MKYFTDKQWSIIPKHLKNRWWKETNYGKQKPSTKLLKEMNGAIEMGYNLEHCLATCKFK